jgi:hypothetical protein
LRLPVEERAVVRSVVGHLDEAQLGAWMGVVNDLRLVLGTRLDISEELDLTAVADDDPEVATFALYSYLSWLLEQMVEAINPR